MESMMVLAGTQNVALSVMSIMSMEVMKYFSLSLAMSLRRLSRRSKRKQSRMGMEFLETITLLAAERRL